MRCILRVLCGVQLLHLIGQVHGHGYLAEPPARSSAWMFDDDFKECCTYYDHAQMFCGGTYHQWVVNGGQCSICGEPYDLKTKLFDMNGKMYLGKIVRTYTQGSTIPVTVVLTANHLGLFEFRICNIDSNNPAQDATQACLDLNVLKTKNGSTKYPITSDMTTVHLDIQLPAELTCQHCVFQWRYQTGNSWGTSNGRSCLGCGKENEEFYGCSDIAITGQHEAIVNSPSLLPPRSPSSSTSTTTTTATAAVSLSPSSTTTKAAATTTTTLASTARASIVGIEEKESEALNCTSIITFSRSFDISDLMDKYCQIVCGNRCVSDNVAGYEKHYRACLDSCDKLCVCD